MRINEALPQFDSFLDKRGLRFEGVIIGAAALIILDIISRETVDVDCLSPTIPEEIFSAAREFRKNHPEHMLIEEWFNNGPESLLRELPKDWRARLRVIFQGNVLTLSTLGRIDLLKTKLFAYCDRGDDLNDCIAMKPSLQELNDSIEWVCERDGNSMWPDHVRKSFELLKKRLNHAKE